jgi:hypothetical protein
MVLKNIIWIIITVLALLFVYERIEREVKEWLKEKK